MGRDLFLTYQEYITWYVIPLLRVHYYFPMDSTKPSPSGRRARKREGTDRKHTSIHLAFILVPYSYLFLCKPFFNAASVTVDGFEMECQCPTNECRQFPEKSIFLLGEMHNKCQTDTKRGIFGSIHGLKMTRVLTELMSLDALR